MSMSQPARADGAAKGARASAKPSSDDQSADLVLRGRILTIEKPTAGMVYDVPHGCDARPSVFPVIEGYGRMPFFQVTDKAVRFRVVDGQAERVRLLVLP